VVHGLFVRGYYEPQKRWSGRLRFEQSALKIVRLDCFPEFDTSVKKITEFKAPTRPGEKINTGMKKDN